jgi:hypothetical protein
MLCLKKETCIKFSFIVLELLQNRSANKQNLNNLKFKIMNSLSKRLIVVMRIKKLGPVAFLIAFAQSINLNMSNVTMFPVPNPALAIFKASIQKLIDAEALAATKAAGAAAARDVALELVFIQLTQLMAYVQQLADALNNESKARTLINASGFFEKRPSIRYNAEVAAKNTDIKGQVKLNCRPLLEKGSYTWQYSLDRGVTWTDIGKANLLTSKMISNLISGQEYQFRVLRLNKDGEGDYSDVVSLVVL